MTPPDRSTRAGRELATLDGLRGIAAFAVALMHFSALAPHAYLAVDLFFVLSGFVLEHAYGARLAGGWPPLRFMARRIRRLYPLYAVSLLLCVAAVGGALLLGRGSGWTWGRLLPAAAAGAVMAPFWSPTGFLYPLNFPAWTLLAELLANLAYALAYRRLTVRVLTVWTVAFALILAALAGRQGSLNAGDLWPTAYVGLARVAFAFPAGVLLRRLIAPGAAPSLPAWAGAAVLPAAAVALYGSGLGLPAWAWDLPIALIAWPALIAVGARAEVSGILRPAAIALGAVSYGAYVTAIPLFVGVHAVLRSRGLDGDILPWPQALAFCVGLFGLALAIRYATRGLRPI